MQANKFSFLRIKQSKSRDSQNKNVKEIDIKPNLQKKQIKAKVLTKYLYSARTNIQEIKTNIRIRPNFPFYPITHRYTKTSLHDSKESLEEKHISDKWNKNESIRSVSRIKSHKKNPKIINSFRQNKKMKNKDDEKFDSRKLIQPFMCKSIEPTPTQRYHSIKQFKSPTSDRKNIDLTQQKMENISYRQQLKRHRRLQNSSAPNQSQAFMTKIKKKRVESNPHLLATIIKRKKEVLSKEQLYQFVNKIISKCSR